MILLDKLSIALLLSLTSLLGGTGMSWVRAAAARRASNRVSADLPPVLLMTPGYYGTLAAARSLGKRFVAITAAGPSPWTVSSFSKYVGTSVSCPPTQETERLLDWLDEFGATHERHVLLPTCDDTAWLFARNRERLKQHYYLGPNEIQTIHALLHKGKLAEHARAVGLDTPRSWFPTSATDLDAVKREAHFPVLIKPTTQALFAPRSKGGVVEDAAHLAGAYQELSQPGHAATIVDYDASSAMPLVQEFFPDASENIYNISGYVQDGKLQAARAGRKLLQRPRRLGIGVCFEEAPLDERLSAGLARLVERVGFSGVFEAEFVRTQGRDLLIDFNPRFYNQMGFDVARDLPLPLLAYHDALTHNGFALPSRDEPKDQPPSGKVFIHASAFKVMVMSQRASGALSTEEADAWLSWYAETAGARIDAVRDPDDVWPGRLDLLQMVRHHVRHPRQFVRSIVLNR
jgi:predicted ATP-grasp superfamily ATP-dependent carboligase